MAQVAGPSRLKRTSEVIDLTDDGVIDLTASPPPPPTNRNFKTLTRGSLVKAEPSIKNETEFKAESISSSPERPRRSPNQRMTLDQYTRHLTGIFYPRADPVASKSPPRQEPVLSQLKREPYEQHLVRSAKREPNTTSSSPPRQEPPPKRRKSVFKDCTICTDTFDAEVLPLRPHTSATANHSICYSCWEQHLHSELERQEWNKLSCPECNEILEVADISALDVYFEQRIEPKIMDKAARSYVKGDPDWVDCPSGTCQAGASMAEGHIFTCQECTFRYCFSCNMPMHEGEACSEYHERLKRDGEKLEEEERSAKLVAEVSKPCPGCQAPIQKNNGCDHMTCRACKHEFCWICNATYGGPTGIHRQGNSAHRDTCQYAPARLPNYNGPRQ